jgi:anaphase-promoting complex subunit 5
MTKAGLYDKAMESMESFHELGVRNLQAYQYLVVALGVIKLRRSLRQYVLITSTFSSNPGRNNLLSADLLLTQLLPSTSETIDAELVFQIRILRIDYLLRLGSFDAGLDAIEDLAENLKHESADVYQRIHVMVLKALLYGQVGKPQKGFTVAMRAANAAWEAKLIPALWEAWGAVANILGALEEFDAEKQILDVIIPQVCLPSSGAFTRSVK